jgi:hypothetical protein
MGRITAFFQRVFKFTYYDKSALERLEGQRVNVAGKGLNFMVVFTLLLRLLQIHAQYNLCIKSM